MSLYVDIKKNLGDFTLDVSLETDGGVTGLLGVSGSGKSLTLMCVAGIVKPDSGVIALNDRVLFDSENKINLPPRERRIGYLFQNYALFPNMTVKQNILCGLKKEKNKRKKLLSLSEIIAITELDGLLSHRPNQLSGGQQQRAALARMLVSEPDLLLLDEPFSAVDSHLRERLQSEMQKLLNRFGKETVLVSHGRDEVYCLCRNTALIDCGKIIAHKDTKRLFTEPGNRQAALLTGCKNIAAARKSGDYEIDVLDWGVTFKTSAPVSENLCAVGVRAHYFDPKIDCNRFPVIVTDELELPFEYNCSFRFHNQPDDVKDVCWICSKEMCVGEVCFLGVAEENVMQLEG